MPRLNLRRFPFPLYLMLIAVFAVMFSSCSASVTVNRDMDELYSRTGVADFVSSSDFGNRKNDDVYTAIDYLYNDETLREHFGGDFEIDPQDVSGGAEFEWIFSFFKGDAQYVVTIEDTAFIVKLKKDYFGKWTVIGCYEETGSALRINVEYVC